MKDKIHPDFHPVCFVDVSSGARFMTRSTMKSKQVEKIDGVDYFMITRDCITVLDAIGMAGDLTRNGDRRKVMVVRQENGRRTAYRIDLSSGNSIYSSPAYYLRQNDVVYVTPR